MSARTDTERYRLHNGKIQVQFGDGDWLDSSHDGVKPSELADYEQTQHPVLPVLRQKFAERTP